MIRALETPHARRCQSSAMGSSPIAMTVDALAPSEESHALPGVRSTGHLDASTSRMGGTSVAVPLHARSCLDPQQPETPPP